MKKNIIGFLILLCVSMFFFGLVQRTEAIKQRLIAEKQTKLALQNSEEANMQMRMAMVNAAESLSQKTIAEQILLECRKRKK